MSLGNWIKSRSVSGMEISTVSNLTKVIDGEGSLRITQSAIAETTALVTGHVSPVFEAPFTKGKIRTLMKLPNVTDDDTHMTFVGCMSMMNQVNTWDNGGNAYFAGRWGKASPEWRIGRVNNGVVSSSSFEILASGNATLVPEENELRAVEFEWVYDETLFSGIRLRLKVGSNTDFSGLTTIYTIFDPSPVALSTSVGEGVFLCTLHDIPGPVVEVIYDKTTIFELLQI
jgi:hypothetical protein